MAPIPGLGEHIIGSCIRHFLIKYFYKTIILFLYIFEKNIGTYEKSSTKLAA